MPRLAGLIFFLMAGAPVTAFCMAKSPSASISSVTTNYQFDRYRLRQQFDLSSPVTQGTKESTSTTSTSMSMINLQSFPRGGAAAAVTSLTEAAKNWNKSPSSLFNSSLIGLAAMTAFIKILQKLSASGQTESTRTKPQSVKDLQIRFLIVFWLLRCADWLQGPYFYEVYASKIFNGAPATLSLVSQLFLTGFASTALFGPWVGRAVDASGRKKGTLAFAVIYALGAISTKSPLLQMLFIGRILSGIGTSLLFSAPESWLVGESQKSGEDPDGSWLGETFGLAYAGDSIVAILAGQFAGAAAAKRGPTGPFELSTGFLALGGLLTSFLWKENKAAKSNEEGESSGAGNSSIQEAVKMVKKDPKIMLVGGVQSLFEAAMYIFVLQWPPAISKAVAKAFGEGAGTPYGTVFSCLMACCLLGSTLFGQLAKMAIPTEVFAAFMLTVATGAMSAATYTVSNSMNLAALVASFFAFEACVGMYFPSIGTLRSKYVPDSHRSVIMNLFGIPLNILVVSVFLTISKLGINGALGVASGALGLAALCMLRLNVMIGKKDKEGEAA